jgi:hypothetical protein
VQRLKNASYVIAGVAALGLVATGAWWLRQGPVSTAPPITRPPAPVATVPAPPAPAASEPAIKHPIEVPVAAESGPAPLDVGAALTELFGRKAVVSMFQLDDFPRRFVATVDNLGRAHAPARLWPVNPADGRFMVEKRGDDQVIAADNGLRYTPYVLLVETVDMRQAVAAYMRLYPLFQQAYEELGYPKRYFNDRLVEVIDELLATPDADGELKVHVPEIKGPLQPERPWVLNEFDDPALQSLSAGQKILLRMVPVNERRMKAKLIEIRRLVTAGAAPR